MCQLGPEGGRHVAGLIKACSSLHTLRINNCALGDEGAVAIAEALSHNEYVTLASMQ